VAKNAVKTPAKTPAKTEAKVPAKATVKAEAKAPVKVPAKAEAKVPAKVTVKAEAKTPVKVPAKTEAKVVAKAAVKPEMKAPAKAPTKIEATDDAGNMAADPVEDGLKLIQSKPEGVLQSELWKELGVDSRKCSRIVKKLEESGLIDRIEFKKDGIKTYLLKARQMPVNPNDLLAGDELIPCISCELECIVEECHPLMDWMYQLAIVQHTED
jgi:Lrp/AsnC family transcriptional regulator, leucine-responsive regulatory protein